ncbi:hypothetical protein SUGI_0105190 [Cryptomeria japonica]|nr:hypothetical protein SUGI_0105190 [Cryptomeria japonica]
MTNQLHHCLINSTKINLKTWQHVPISGWHLFRDKIMQIMAGHWIGVCSEGGTWRDQQVVITSDNHSFL